MKVLQLCNKAPYPANDGSSIAIKNLAEGLFDNSIELHLLTINTKKHFKPDSQIPISFKSKTHYQSVYKNTNPVFINAILNLFANQSYFVSRFFFDDYSNALINKLKIEQFDIIQLEGVFMASYIPIIREYSNAKIVLRAHNIEFQIWERHLKNETSWFKKTYINLQKNRLKTFELNTFKQVDAIVTITNEDKNSILAFFSDKKIHVSLTGVNLNTYVPVKNVTEPNTVFHFASMDWLPNIEATDWFLNFVWNKVETKLPDCKLVLAGKNMPERLKRITNKNILVLDYVDDAAKFYNTYDIMLVPLWSGSGLRIKLVEGLAYGKPIITTSIGAEGIPYTKDENLLIADSADEFAENIIKLLKDYKLKENIKEKAIILANTHFDYKKIGAELVEFYKNL